MKRIQVAWFPNDKPGSKEELLKSHKELPYISVLKEGEGVEELCHHQDAAYKYWGDVCYRIIDVI